MALLAESESYTDKLGLDRKLAGVGSREEAKERVTTWRKDTSLLSHHINAQMDDCKKLLASDTLDSILRDDPKVSDHKRFVQHVDRLKNDIRCLNHRYCVMALDMDPDEPAQPSAAVAAGDEYKTNEWQRRMHSIEEQLKEHKLSTLDSTKFSVVANLEDLREDMIVDICEYMGLKKSALDAALGVSSDVLQAVDTDGPAAHASKDIRHFFRLLESFGELEQLLRQANLSADSVRHSRAMAKLKKQKEAVERELHMSELANKQLQESVTILRNTASERPSGAQTMKLDEAVMRMRELERTLAKTAAEHATVAQRCGVLQDTVDRLRMAGEETRRRHEAETSWYTPRIKELTETVKVTQANMAQLQLDVELLSSMYKSGCDDLDVMQAKMEAADAERLLMAKKLHEEIQKLVWSHQELKRKDDIAVRLNAARLSALETTEMCKTLTNQATGHAGQLERKLANTEKILANTKKELVTTQQALKNAQSENLSLLKDAENYDQRLADVRKAKAEVDEELRLMEKKVVDAGLDDVSLSRFQQMESDLLEAWKKSQFLEGEVARKDVEIEVHMNDLAKLRKQIQGEGLDPVV